MKSLIIIVLIVLLSSCATPEKAQIPPPFPPTPRATLPSTPSKKIQPQVDLDELQRHLGMNYASSDLGIHEKRFNSCKVGAGYSTSGPCHNHHFSILNLRLQCRASEGTTESVSEYELQPLQKSEVSWQIGLVKGTVDFDDEGYGQIRFVAPGSSKSQKLMLIKSPNSMRLPVNEARRIVVPADWCEYNVGDNKGS